jgi:hypothetical protein
LLSAFIPGSTLVGIIFRSANQGDTWTQVAANGTDIYTKIKQHAADTIWTTGRFGRPVLSYSVNNGATWVNRPISGFSAIWDIEFGPGSTIFLGSESEGVTRSYDGGATWTLGEGNTILWYSNFIEVEMDNTGYLFAATDWWTNMLWFSVPGSNGNVWTEFLDPDLSGLNDINDLIFDNNNNAYIATNNGQYVDPVYMATNQVWNANTDWVSSSVGLPLASQAAALELDIAGYLYVVTYFNSNGEGGLYRSTSPVNSALPVEFVESPRVRKVTDGMEVLWHTATEHHCSHFEVERSSNGIDFHKIATVKGNGTTNEQHVYSALDRNPLTGINYYRIKEIDRDDKFVLSKIITAQYDNFEVHVFPNPTTGYLHLKTDKIIDHITIADYFGKEVKSIFQPGADIDIADLPDGLYLLKVWDAGNQFKNIKISKLKSHI